MKKILLYSFCGCFMTSAAVAFSFYVDLNPNSDCPDGHSFCLTKPEDGYCCPDSQVFVGINNPTLSSNKVSRGTYITDSSTGTEVMLFAPDGSAVSTKGLSTSELQVINSATTETSTGNAKLSVKENNAGDLYMEINGDDVAVYNEPTRSPSCDRVHMVLKTCTEYRYNSNGGGTTCSGPQVLGHIYYKKGAGYFTNSNYSSSSRLKDDSMTSGTTLSVPSRSGYTFRGYFTSVWTDAVAGASTLTQTSSYINNLNPYRTIGHAYIPWRNEQAGTNVSGNELFLRTPNWVITGPGVTCPAVGYEIDLYAGWAKNCESDEYCNMTINGRNTVSNYLATATNGTSITGQWLPGAVKYERTGTCKSGEPSGTEYVTKKYGSQTLTFALGTSDLGCVEEGATGPTRITINYYDASGTKKGYTYCNVGDTVTLNGPSTLTGVTAFKYKDDTSGSTTFTRGGTYPCNVGTRGFTQYTTSGDYYIVNLDPASLVNDPGSGNGESGKGVNVTLNLNGGTLRDSSGEEQEGSVSVVVDKGGNLGDYVVETKIGQPEFTGWRATGSTGASERNPVVNAEVGASVSYEATFACPEGTKDFNGTCLAVSKGDGGEEELIDTIIDRGGNPVNPAQGQTCWRAAPGGGRVNYCYWKINIQFHGKPSTAPSSLVVTDPNDGKTLYCNGTPCYTRNNHWCAEYYSHGEHVCQSMYVPTAPGYKFRGYFRDPSLPSTIVTEASTTEGKAFSKFFPKSITATKIDVLQHAVIIMMDHVVDPDDTYPDTVHLYGGWARTCDTSDPNAVCDLRIGTNWTIYNNLEKGQVRYDTSCVNGYILAGGNGTYSPICETEKGGEASISYVFKDQFGNTVSCNGPTQQCELAGNITLINKAAVRTACGNNYDLKYLITDNKNWYSPGKQNVSCSTNELGAEPRTIIGTVCKNICTIGQHYDDLHATCVGLTNQGDAMPTSLGVTMPRITNYNNTSYWVVNGADMVQNLWGTCSGGTCTADCPTLQCDEGYGLVVDSTGPHCTPKGNSGVSCPSSGYAPAANSNVTISGPNKSGTSCSYTIGCSAGVPEWETGTAAGSTVVTCTGSQCTSSWVQNQLNGKSCFVCPHYNGAHWSVSPGVPTQSGFQCTYHILCNGRVACPRILKKDGTSVTQPDAYGHHNSDYVTCDESNNHQCTAGYGPYQSLYFLTTEFGKYECVNTSSGYDDCGGTSQPEYTCPTTNLPTIDHGEISNTSTCYYKPTCASGYECNTSTQLCDERACNNATNCNALFAQYRDHASDLCQEPVHVDCPETTETGVPSLEHGEVTRGSSTDTKCTYEFECDEGYQLWGGATAMCSRNNPSNLCTIPWLKSQINSRSCQFSNGKGDDGEGGDGGDKEGEGTNSES